MGEKTPANQGEASATGFHTGNKGDLVAVGGVPRLSGSRCLRGAVSLVGCPRRAVEGKLDRVGKGPSESERPQMQAEPGHEPRSNEERRALLDFGNV